jgi:hypothetical protein
MSTTCLVVRCRRPGTEVVEMPRLDGRRAGGFVVCEQHRRQIAEGAEWRFQPDGSDQVYERGYVGNLVVMGADLLDLNEWVVDHVEGIEVFDTRQVASDPAGETLVCTIVARQRGQAQAEPLRLVLTAQQLRDVIEAGTQPGSPVTRGTREGAQ